MAPAEYIFACVIIRMIPGKPSYIDQRRAWYFHLAHLSIASLLCGIGLQNAD